MKILNDQIVSQVKGVFDAQLQKPVEILFFGKQKGCETCVEGQQLLEEVAEISDKLHVTVYDLDKNAQEAELYRVDKVPGMVLLARDGDELTDYGVRFAGIPSGHEFSSLIHDIILVSGRDSGLNPQTRDALQGLSEKVLLQVFVTPT